MLAFCTTTASPQERLAEYHFSLPMTSAQVEQWLLSFEGKDGFMVLGEVQGLEV